MRITAGAPDSTFDRIGLETLPFPTRRLLALFFFVNMLQLISRNCTIKLLQVTGSFEKSDFFPLLRLEMLFIVERDHLAYSGPIRAPVSEP
jgi:hypothetical protein